MSTPTFFDYATTYACLAAAQAFLEMALKVLVLSWSLVATNPQARVTLLLLIYFHWFKLVASSGGDLGRAGGGGGRVSGPICPIQEQGLDQAIQ